MGINELERSERDRLDDDLEDLEDLKDPEDPEDDETGPFHVGPHDKSVRYIRPSSA